MDKPDNEVPLRDLLQELNVEDHDEPKPSDRPPSNILTVNDLFNGPPLTGLGVDEGPCGTSSIDERVLDYVSYGNEGEYSEDYLRLRLLAEAVKYALENIHKDKPFTVAELRLAAHTFLRYHELGAAGESDEKLVGRYGADAPHLIQHLIDHLAPNLSFAISVADLLDHNRWANLQHLFDAATEEAKALGRSHVPVTRTEHQAIDGRDIAEHVKMLGREYEMACNKDDLAASAVAEVNEFALRMKPLKMLRKLPKVDKRVERARYKAYLISVVRRRNESLFVEACDSTNGGDENDESLFVEPWDSTNGGDENDESLFVEPWDSTNGDNENDEPQEDGQKDKPQEGGRESETQGDGRKNKTQGGGQKNKTQAGGRKSKAQAGGRKKKAQGNGQTDKPQEDGQNDKPQEDVAMAEPQEELTIAAPRLPPPPVGKPLTLAEVNALFTHRVRSAATTNAKVMYASKPSIHGYNHRLHITTNETITDSEVSATTTFIEDAEKRAKASADLGEQRKIWAEIATAKLLVSILAGKQVTSVAASNDQAEAADLKVQRHAMEARRASDNRKELEKHYRETRKNIKYYKQHVANGYYGQRLEVRVAARRQQGEDYATSVAKLKEKREADARAKARSQVLKPYNPGLDDWRLWAEFELSDKEGESWEQFCVEHNITDAKAKKMRAAAEAKHAKQLEEAERQREEEAKAAAKGKPKRKPKPKQEPKPRIQAPERLRNPNRRNNKAFPPVTKAANTTAMTTNTRADEVVAAAGEMEGADTAVPDDLPKPGGRKRKANQMDAEAAETKEMTPDGSSMPKARKRKTHHKDTNAAMITEMTTDTRAENVVAGAEEMEGAGTTIPDVGAGGIAPDTGGADLGGDVDRMDDDNEDDLVNDATGDGINGDTTQDDSANDGVGADDADYDNDGDVVMDAE